MEGIVNNKWKWRLEYYEFTPWDKSFLSGTDKISLIHFLFVLPCRFGTSYYISFSLPQTNGPEPHYHYFLFLFSFFVNNSHFHEINNINSKHLGGDKVPYFDMCYLAATELHNQLSGKGEEVAISLLDI